jgi:hypothetical protein
VPPRRHARTARAAAVDRVGRAGGSGGLSGLGGVPIHDGDRVGVGQRTLRGAQLRGPGHASRDEVGADGVGVARAYLDVHRVVAIIHSRVSFR